MDSIQRSHALWLLGGLGKWQGPSRRSGRWTESKFEVLSPASSLPSHLRLPVSFYWSHSSSQAALSTARLPGFQEWLLRLWLLRAPCWFKPQGNIYPYWPVLNPAHSFANSLFIELSSNYPTACVICFLPCPSYNRLQSPLWSGPCKTLPLYLTLFCSLSLLQPL